MNKVEKINITLSLDKSPPIEHLSPTTLEYNIENLCYAPYNSSNKIFNSIPKFNLEKNIKQ
jgi:hypothetical protein